MKSILLCLLLVGGQALTAQTVVISGHDKNSETLTRELREKYGSAPNNNFETPYSLQKRFTDICQNIAGTEMQDQLSIRAVFYFNEQGGTDYLYFALANQLIGMKPGETRKLNLDSLSAIFKERLQPAVANIVSKRTIGRKAVVSTYASFNFSRPTTGEAQVPKDSVIKSVAAALEVQDTLKVKELSLNRSMLTSLPEVIYRFPNLERLFLADNDIENVYIDLQRLPRLKQVDLSGNILKNNSVNFPKNKTLTSLNLQKTLVDDIPPAVRNCKKLHTLWLGSNQLSHLSNSSFKKARAVRDLNLYKAGLTSLPKGIRKMRKLEVLDLYYNQIEELSKSICKLKKLTHLAVSHNQISALPEKIYKLKKLHTLYAHHNHLSKLPPQIVRMQNLKILDLGYNWLTNFPDQVVAFSNLQELDLSGNNFSQFPQQLLQIKKLDKLYLRGNPFLGENRETIYEQQFSLLKSRNIEVFY